MTIPLLIALQHTATTLQHIATHCNVVWSAEDVDDRVARLQERWVREKKEELAMVHDVFAKERELLQRQVKITREETSDDMSRLETEVRDANVWASETGREAADLRVQVRDMQTKLVEQQNAVRDLRVRLKHLESRLQSDAGRKYSATPCNTLQHTATHMYTLQHTAAHCNTQCVTRECN